MAEERNVLVLHFPDPSKAFQALSQIKTTPGVAGAAVVERTEEGQVRVAEEYDPNLGTGTAVGGLVGAMVGIIGGPLGVLLGWTTGVLAGVAYDSDVTTDEDDGFTILSKSIPAGGNALIVEMSETSHAAADDIAAKLDGTVTRIPATEVEAEVASAQEAARRAAAEARKARWEKRRAGFKEKLSGLVHHAKSS